jgi:hypothetical protein
MPTFYLQEGLRPLPPKEERRTHNNESGVFLDDRLHTFDKKENTLLDTFEAENWIEAREQINDWAYN